MGEVTIHFRGACTQFIGVVPGVPHRAVLVDGMAVRFQLISWPDGPTDHPYLVSPHIPLVYEVSGGQTRLLNAPGAIVESVIYAGARLRIANPSGLVLTYDQSYFADTVPRLRHFSPRYEYSTDVVYGGRASCYFDVNAGLVSPENIAIDGLPAYHTKVVVMTDGDPILRVTPFSLDFAVDPGAGNQALPTDIALEDGCDLYINHLGLGCAEPTSNFDFMLHYLSDQAGIPQRVAKQPLGSPEVGSQGVIDQQSFFEPMRKLLEAGFPSPSRSLTEALLKTDIGTTASCSDAQYP